MSLLPMRPLGFGEIIDGALQLYRRNFGLFYLIALAAAFPGYVLMQVLGVNFAALGFQAGDDPFQGLDEMGRALAVVAASLAFYWVGSVAQAVAMRERIEERSASLGRAYREALMHVPSTLGATVLGMLILFGIVIVAGVIMVPALAFFVTRGGGAGAVGSAVIGGLTAFAAMAIWIGATFAIIPAVVVENRGAAGALARSVRLCRGAWLRVLGIVVVAFTITLTPRVGIYTLFGMGDVFVSPAAQRAIGSTEQWLINTIDLVIVPLTAPVMMGSIMVLFHDRRLRTEALDLETRAAALDESQ